MLHTIFIDVSIDSDSSIEVKRLKEVLLRLQNENAQWRKKVELVEIILRRRAPQVSGLSLKGAVETILSNRDESLNQIGFYREELSLILKMLLSDKFEEAKKELNVFLYKNPK